MSIKSQREQVNPSEENDCKNWELLWKHRERGRDVETVKCSNTLSDRSNGKRQSELRRNEWQKDGNEKRDSLSKAPWSENEVYLFKPAIVPEFHYDEQWVNILFFNLSSICICSRVLKWAVGSECSKDKRNIVMSILQPVVQRNDILKQFFSFSPPWK